MCMELARVAGICIRYLQGRAGVGFLQCSHGGGGMQKYTQAVRRRALAIACGAAAMFHAGVAVASTGNQPAVFGIPVDFILFALTLLGVALFHKYTLRVALTGLAVITLYKLGFTGFKSGDGLPGLLGHLAHEWVILTNLLGLLVGFALLSNHFEKSHVPQVLPRFLPDDWKGGFVLLVIIFVLSAFLDNIAAALIGGTIAATVFRRKVHIGYLAAIVAASNAGGSGSVVGDTTTTMMWLDGVNRWTCCMLMPPLPLRWWCSVSRLQCSSSVIRRLSKTKGGMPPSTGLDSGSSS
jgi:Citrate transporter